MEDKFLIHLGLDVLGLNRNLLSLSQKQLSLAKMALITWRLLIILALPGLISFFFDLKLYVWGIFYIILVFCCSLLIARKVNQMILYGNEKKPITYWLLIITGAVFISVFIYLPTVVQLYMGDKLLLLSYGYSFAEIFSISKDSLVFTMLFSLLIIILNIIPFYLIMNGVRAYRLAAICVNKTNKCKSKRI
jgi:hypothetical protein